MTAPLSEQQLAEIRAREAAAAAGPWETDTYTEHDGSTSIGVANTGDLWIVPLQNLDPADAEFIAHARADVPALLADNDRLRARAAELETFAYGCDGEGCVLPHSSWCEPAKKFAAGHDGCTCGRPWESTPQPHAGHCWVLDPPRSEVDELRKRVADLGAERDKLIRWHAEDGKQIAKVDRLRARTAELEAERHTTNEALDGAVAAIKAKAERIAELEQQLAAARADDYQRAVAAQDAEPCACCTFGNHTEPCTCDGGGCCHPHHHETGCTCAWVASESQGCPVHPAATPGGAS
jgi:hypothetical protein